MDKTKPPGISFDDIILKELTFSRKENFSNKPELSINLESRVAFSSDEKKLAYEMSCKIQDKSEYFNIRCSMLAFFSVVEGQENMTLKEYSAYNAPAAIFPYIRETIASITTKAGIPAVMIPPVNLNTITKKTLTQETAKEAAP